jgi:hypothetical protein
MFSSGPQSVSPVILGESLGTPREPGETPAFNSSPNIPLACLIAARASRKLRFVYALARLAISMEIMSVPTIELDPTHSPNIPKSVFPEAHIRMTTAITSAYSCIEELGLEIRASQKNPSRINDAWNPVVKNELEQRLRQAGVNLAEEFYWNLRGKRARIEIRRQPEMTKRAPWGGIRSSRRANPHYRRYCLRQLPAQPNSDP